MVDAGTLEEILWHLHNWFEKDSKSYSVTDCEIGVDGLPASFAEMLHEGQWYRVQGSWLNDGLHRHPDEGLRPETFDGVITLMRIPAPLLAIAEDVTAWKEKNAEAVESPYASESFGGYSYSLKGEMSAQNGSQGLTGWRAVFRDRLGPWRKI